MLFLLIVGVASVVVFALVRLSSPLERSGGKRWTSGTSRGNESGTEAWMYSNAINASFQSESGHHAPGQVNCDSGVHHAGSVDCGVSGHH